MVHSNQYFGGNELSFKIHNSFDNAYQYSVNITNKNSIDIDYSFILNNPFFGNDNIDMSKINFSLYNGDAIVSSGILENKAKVTLSNIKIKSNDIDQFNLKVWSYEINEDFKFSFKIEIIV